MERVGFIALSIVAASLLLVGASYGALWLQPLLMDLPVGWMIAATMAMVTAGMLFHRRKRARA